MDIYLMLVCFCLCQYVYVCVQMQFYIYVQVCMYAGEHTGVCAWFACGSYRTTSDISSGASLPLSQQSLTIQAQLAWNSLCRPCSLINHRYPTSQVLELKFNCSLTSFSENTPKIGSNEKIKKVHIVRNILPLLREVVCLHMGIFFP